MTDDAQHGAYLHGRVGQGTKVHILIGDEDGKINGTACHTGGYHYWRTARQPLGITQTVDGVTCKSCLKKLANGTITNGLLRPAPDETKVIRHQDFYSGRQGPRRIRFGVSAYTAPDGTRFEGTVHQILRALEASGWRIE